MSNDKVQSSNEAEMPKPEERGPQNISLFDIEFLRVVFPAACGEFVIPAEAGIQKTGLDSASSAE